MPRPNPALPAMPQILLTTLNAKYIHAALGLRYLYANMGDLQSTTLIKEFTIEHRPRDIAEQLLAHEPQIIGFGVYIWNVTEITAVVAMLKALRPDIRIVLGGPEVSYEQDAQSIVALADYVITGWGDLAFAELCKQLLEDAAPDNKIIAGGQPELAGIRMPYTLYNDDDIAHRLLYVEASRGCPFKCEFCLSALDKTAWPFDLDAFLDHMADLYARGARHFKFVDRTFNLKIKSSIQILEFFLARLDEKLFLHFEVVPDHLPDSLKAILPKFPPGSLQFEIGIQTFNPDVQSLISRRQDNLKAKENIQWLRSHTHAHIHADLIAGLPGEDLNSFAASFDQLIALGPQEIQVGILKRLRGSVITRHTHTHNMRYNPLPPYEILSNDLLSFTDVQRLQRFARYWDLVANSGRFKHSLPLILGDTPFQRFMQFSDWVYEQTGQTHRLALQRWYELIAKAAPELLQVDPEQIETALRQDADQAYKKPAKPQDHTLTKIKQEHRREQRQLRHLA